jgi:hypothetical protein
VRINEELFISSSGGRSVGIVHLRTKGHEVRSRGYSEVVAS